MSLAAGTRLGPYEIAAVVGAGGMGEVYRARDVRLDRTVAIKILPADVAADPDRRDRFEREARAVAALNHPHICVLHDVGHEQDLDFIVMEYVEGETLADRVRRGPLSMAEAKPIALQIAEALDAAHEKGIVHRDLKPANVRITPEGVVKVLDFGLAKALDPVGSGSVDASNSPTFAAGATRFGLILGTAAYMSPEQARGLRVDRRTDIWAFGCVLFEMLTGRQVFGGETVTDMLAAVVKRDPDWSLLPADIPQAVRRTLGRCLEKDLKRRLRDIADARLDLEEAPELVSESVDVVSTPAPTFWWKRRVPVVLLATLAVALAAGGWWAVGGSAAKRPRRLNGGAICSADRRSRWGHASHPTARCWPFKRWSTVRPRWRL
jgi:eukaryotic-like serine/threonine-protein kinase